MRMFCCCLKKTKGELKSKQILDAGLKRLKTDFDFLNVLEGRKMCRYETEELVKNKVVSYSNYETD